MELINKVVHRISQQIKQLLKVSQKNQLQMIVGMLTVFLFSSCKEYLALGVTLAFIPELLFGIFIAGFFIVVIIGGIIQFLSGGDRK